MPMPTGGSKRDRIRAAVSPTCCSAPLHAVFLSRAEAATVGADAACQRLHWGAACTVQVYSSRPGLGLYGSYGISEMPFPWGDRGLPRMGDPAWVPRRLHALAGSMQTLNPISTRNVSCGGTGNLGPTQHMHYNITPGLLDHGKGVDRCADV